MLRQFFLHTLNLPYPLASWLSAFCDALYALVVTPGGILFALAFLLIGYLRFSLFYVGCFAAMAAFGIVQTRSQGWAGYSDDWRLQQMIVLVSATMALCLTANFIGRRLRPHYI
jgi:hypothetical protein